MIRLAHGNGFKIHDFYAEFFGRERQIWNRDIDHHAPQWLIDGLSQHSGLPVARVEAMTLRAFGGTVFEALNEAGNTRWVMPVGVYHRLRRAHGQQFCPLCLDEREAPYMRRGWRLSLSAACVRHGILLQDRCSDCGKPVVPHRADTTAGRFSRGRLGLHRCAFCRADLAAPLVRASAAACEVQERIDDVIECGFAMLAGRPIYSHLFFDGLKLLMLGMSRLGLAAASGGAFDRAPAQERLQRLEIAMEHLEGWPAMFIARCRPLRHAYTGFSRHASCIPYWLNSVLRSEFLRSPAPLSVAEAASIGEAAIRILGAGSPTNMRRLSGRDVGHLARPAPVSRAIANRLMASIDERVARADDLSRLLELRDKAMFAAARYLQLTMPALLKLRIADIVGSCAVEFQAAGPVNSSRRVVGMLAWYANQVRPRLCVDATEDALFLTRAGRPMETGALGMRFDQATRKAGMTQEIPSWTRWIAPERP